MEDNHRLDYHSFKSHDTICKATTIIESDVLNSREKCYRQHGKPPDAVTKEVLNHLKIGKSHITELERRLTLAYLSDNILSDIWRLFDPKFNK